MPPARTAHILCALAGEVAEMLLKAFFSIRSLSPSSRHSSESRNPAFSPPLQGEGWVGMVSILARHSGEAGIQ